MRKMVSMACAIALTCVGIYILAWQFIFAETIRGMVVMGGGFFLAVGGLWFHQDIKDRWLSSE